MSDAIDRSTFLSQSDVCCVCVCVWRCPTLFRIHFVNIFFVFFIVFSSSARQVWRMGAAWASIVSARCRKCEFVDKSAELINVGMAQTPTKKKLEKSNKNKQIIEMKQFQPRIVVAVKPLSIILKAMFSSWQFVWFTNCYFSFLLSESGWTKGWAPASSHMNYTRSCLHTYVHMYVLDKSLAAARNALYISPTTFPFASLRLHAFNILCFQ